MVQYIEAYCEESDFFDQPETLSDYDLIRVVLSPMGNDLEDEEIDAILDDVLAGMSPEEIEGFWSTIGNFARRVAPTLLPAAGTALGTVVGGPVGAAIGGTIGRVAGQAFGGRQRQAPRRTPTPPQITPRIARRTTAVQAPAPIPSGGSSALGQLISLIQNPIFLQSLLGRVLGGGAVRLGQESIEIPFGAFMNALSQLATQAAREANADQESSVDIPDYLQDEEGNFLCEDPAVPEQRAQVLLELLNEAFPAEADNEAWVEDFDELTEWFIEAGWIRPPLY